MTRVAAIPVLLALIGWMEARHPVSAFRVFSFFFVFLVFADLASLLRGKGRDGLVVLASLAFGLCVVEGIATLREPKASTTITQGRLVPRPVIGWGPDHAGRFHAEMRDPAGAVIYVADYTIDANLLRQTTSSRERFGNRLFRQFLYLRRWRERRRNIASGFRGSHRPQRANSQSCLFRLWTAAIPARIGNGLVRFPDRRAAAALHFPDGGLARRAHRLQGLLGRRTRRSMRSRMAKLRSRAPATRVLAYCCGNGSRTQPPIV